MRQATTRRGFLKMAAANAHEALRKRYAASSVKAGVLEELKTRLHLRSTPGRIEAYDISNTGGSHPVGAMVTFRNGAPASFAAWQSSTGQDAHSPANTGANWTAARRWTQTVTERMVLQVDAPQSQAAIGVMAVIVIVIVWSMLPTKSKAPEGLTIDVNKQYFATVKMAKGGEFVVPPAKAEEMYSPEVFGRSGSDRVIVE